MAQFWFDAQPREERRRRAPVPIMPRSAYFTVVMETLRDAGPLHRLALRDRVADAVGLNAEERTRTTPKGTKVFQSRIHWAGVVLTRAGLLERPSRGHLAISERGREFLLRHPEGVTERLVKSYGRGGPVDG